MVMMTKVACLYLIIFASFLDISSTFRLNPQVSFAGRAMRSPTFQISFKQPLKPLYAKVPSSSSSSIASVVRQNETQTIFSNRPIPSEETPLLTSSAVDSRENNWKEYSYLAIFLLIFSHNQLCRQLIYYFCDFSSSSSPSTTLPSSRLETSSEFQYMNQDLQFSKDQYASLASVGFTFFFVAGSFFAGAAADRFSRTNVIALSCLIWSIVTALHGRAESFAELVPLRGLLGISQAFLNPAIYTLISEIFPKSLIGTANGIYSGGIYVGGGLASLSILLDQSIGWRSSFVAIGFIGFAFAALAKFTIPEPRDQVEGSMLRRSSTEVTATRSSIANTVEQYFNDVKEICSNSQAQTLFLASMFRFLAGFTIAVWKAPFVFEQFPSNQDYFAGTNAAIITFGGLSSTLFGGWLSDYISKDGNNIGKENLTNSNNRKFARSWIPMVGSFLAIPFWIGFMTITDPSIALASLLLEYLVAECWFGPTLASLFQSISPNKRGTAQSLFAVLTAVGNVGPNIVAFLVNQQFSIFPAFSSTQNSLIVIVGAAYFISGLLFWKAARTEQLQLNS